MENQNNQKQQITVMVVEDEELLLQAVTKKLTLNNMKVISCIGGQQALDYLKSLPKFPDVIWLDYYLQDLNGLEFMEELNKVPAYSKIPVLVVSNSASNEKVYNMLRLGAKRYILKADYRLDEIIKILKELVAKSGEI